MDVRLNRRDWLRSAGLAGLGLLGARGLKLSAQTGIEPPPPEGRHINLAGNENPFGPAPAVVQAIVRATPQSSRYPFREEYVLTELLAKREGVAVENIVLGNGCDEILALAAAAFLSGGGDLVAADPTYFQITDYAGNIGGAVRRIPHLAETMQHDLAAMAAAVDDRVKLVYVCNPDNPSGTILPAAEVARFARHVVSRAPVFIDEVYLDLQDDFAGQTQVPLVRAGLPVIIGRSFSKSHGLAGHRIGYAVTTPELAVALRRRQMSSVNYLGVAAARASLFETRFHAWSVGKIREGRARYAALLDELGLRSTPSCGNFIFHEVKRPMGEFQAQMKELGFLVGWPHAPAERYPDWCRVSIGTDDEMAKYHVALRGLFQA